MHRNIIFTIALPADKEQFLRLSQRGDSDFIGMLEEKYRETGEALWHRYQPMARKIQELTRALRKQGVEIVEGLTLDKLHVEPDTHALIVVAHRSRRDGGPELFDRAVTDEEFVESLPEDFSGWLDISTCSSERLLSLARIHFHNPDAHIIAPDRETALLFRLEFYREIIEDLVKNPERDYFESFTKTVARLLDKSKDKADGEEDLPVVLGSKAASSSVFAPAEAVKGQQFMVQVFIHVDSSSGEISLMATDADADAEKKRTVPLAIKGRDVRLKRGDELTITLRPTGNSDDFEFETPRKKTIFYSGADTSAEFVIKVKEEAQADSFFGHVKIAVNRLPAAEASFKVKLVSRKSGEMRPVELSLTPFNIEKEMISARNEMLANLSRKREELTAKYEESANEAERSKLEGDLKVCNRCIALLEHRFDEISNVKKVVFISSTSDLSTFRKVLEEQIKSCDMVPEMYEYWPQGNMTPSDACCAKVLSSDILVAILGAKYGFIKPDSGMSMTEMELKCALQAGKPVLIYVLRDYKDRMRELLPEEKEGVEKQNRLIERIETERLIKYINDEVSLSTISGRELERLKRSIQPG